MRRSKFVGAAGLALLSVLFCTGTAPAGSTDKSRASNTIKCTPHKRYTGPWSPWKAITPSSLRLVSWRPYVKYPKGSGHVVVGGTCHVNHKGLGKRGKDVRHMLGKPVLPKPPTTVVGNPPTDILSPPPPVAPPAPVLIAALSLTETANVNDVLVDMNQNIDKFDVSIDGIAVGTVIHQANGVAADLPVHARIGQTAMVCQEPDIFGFLPDGNACQSHTFTSADAASKFVFAFHNHKNVQFSCEDLIIVRPLPGQTSVLMSLQYHELNATPIYANFDYGDGTGQHTSLGGDNNLFGGSVIYPGPGLYKITGIVYFSISNGPSLSPLTVSTIAQPATFDLAHKSCTKWVQILPAPSTV